jgi:hypothetical protein
MKRPLKIFLYAIGGVVTLAILAFVISTAWVVTVLVMASGQKSDTPRADCSMDIGGYQINVQLFSTNPWQSENDKHLSITAPDGRVLATEVFYDPGGYSAIYFFDEENELIVLGGPSDAVTLDKSSQTALRSNRRDYNARVQPSQGARSAYVNGDYTCIPTAG